MRIHKREQDEVVILDLQGKLAGAVTGSGGLSELALEQIDGPTPAARGGHKVLLNLADCTGADSLGIGELIGLHVGLAKRGGRLKLLRLPQRVEELLRATQLISMFEVFEDEGEALESFG